MPPRKRSRTTAGESSAFATIHLAGGHAHPQRTIDKFRSGALTDVELQASDGTTFCAHALCLTAGSEYMEALFAGGWPDAGRTIKLAEIPAVALGACLDFIYCGEAFVEPEHSTLLHVLEAASYLQIPPLIDAAAEALKGQLGGTTALATYAVAERQGLTDLAAAAMLSAAKHFGAVVASEDWLCSPVEAVRTLLGSDRLATKDEVDVYNAALAWLRAQEPPLVDEDAAALLSLVRFPQLSRDFVRDTVNKEPLLCTMAGLRVLRDAAFGALYGDTAAAGTQRRLGFERWIYAVGGVGDAGKVMASVERYDAETKQWQAMAPMSTAREWARSVALDGFVYAFGGNGGTTLLASVERYDPTTNQWEAVAPMSQRRAHHGVAVADGLVYAVGGTEGIKYLASVERYDPKTNQWEAMAPMSHARSLHAVTALDGLVYVFGGNTEGTNYLASVERYDPTTNQWEAVAPMSQKRSSFGVAAVDGHVYAVGGRENISARLASVERYDPKTNQWEAMAPMGTARSSFACCALDTSK